MGSLLLFKPATVLKWHRELVKHKWTFRHGMNKVGRLRLSEEFELRVVRLARENPALELPGYDVGMSTVRDVLRRPHMLPVPERDWTHINWRTFLNHDGTQMLDGDFFTIERTSPFQAGLGRPGWPGGYLRHGTADPSRTCLQFSVLPGDLPPCPRTRPVIDHCPPVTLVTVTPP